MPHLARTTVILGLLSLVLAGQWVFTDVAVLTQGEPDGSTDNVFYRIYELGFQFFQLGPASAGAVLLLVAVAIVAAGVILVRRVRRG